MKPSAQNPTTLIYRSAERFYCKFSSELHRRFLPSSTHHQNKSRSQITDSCHTLQRHKEKWSRHCAQHGQLRIPKHLEHCKDTEISWYCLAYTHPKPTVQGQFSKTKNIKTNLSLWSLLKIITNFLLITSGGHMILQRFSFCPNTTPH